MPQDSVFRGIILFLDKIGIYDVILPFLLTFTIVYAFLEKTKILGTDTIKKDGATIETSKKNLNSIAAFAIGFFVVASSWIVGIINEAMANIVLLVLVSMCFLLLIGSFAYTPKDKDGRESPFFFLEEGPWRTGFMILMTIGVAVVFLHALGWLHDIWDYLVDHWQTNFVGSIILIALVAVFIHYVTKDK